MLLVFLQMQQKGLSLYTREQLSFLTGFNNLSCVFFIGTITTSIIFQPSDLVSFIHNNFQKLNAKVFERLCYILYRISISLVVDQEFAPFTTTTVSFHKDSSGGSK